MKKYFSYILAILLLTLALSLEAQENKAYLKDGKIVVETKEGVRTVDYSTKNDYSNTTSKKWNISENVSPVDEALSVYKNKSEPVYKHKIHFYSESDRDVKHFIEYLSDDDSSSYLLSPQGNHLYYLGLNSTGGKYIYGHNLKENKKFPVSSGSNAHIIACDDDTSFVLVEQAKNERYDVFDVEGNKINTITQTGEYTEIQDKIKAAVCI